MDPDCRADWWEYTDIISHYGSKAWEGGGDWTIDMLLNAPYSFPPVPSVRRVAECLGDPSECATDALSCAADPLGCTFPLWAPRTTWLENFIRRFSRWAPADLHPIEGGITVIENCQGLCRVLMDYALQGAPAFTVGHTIFAQGDIMNWPDTLQEELNHVRQYERFGDGFLYGYLGNVLAVLPICGTDVDCHRNLNMFERTAQP